ncbi:MAG: hypothetical protein ACRD1D_05075 [Acidimicrobiales bacterium]
MVELVGPRLRDRDDAVAALRVSSTGDGPESIVVLVCDRDLRVLLAIDMEGAPASGVATAVGLVLQAVAPESKLIVGLFRAGDLDRAEVEAVKEAESLCLDHDVDLVDVFVVSECGWDAVDAIAGTGYGDDNGHQ